MRRHTSAPSGDTGGALVLFWLFVCVCILLYGLNSDSNQIPNPVFLSAGIWTETTSAESPKWTSPASRTSGFCKRGSLLLYFSHIVTGWIRIFSWRQRHHYILVLQPHVLCFEVCFDESQTIPKKRKVHVTERYLGFIFIFLSSQTIQNANVRYLQKHAGWKSFFKLWQCPYHCEWPLLTEVIFSWPNPNSLSCVNIAVFQLLTRHKTLNDSKSHYPDIKPVWYQICSPMPVLSLVLLVVTRILLLLRGLLLNQTAPCRSNYTNVIFNQTGPYVPIGETTLHKMCSHPNERCQSRPEHKRSI